MSSIASRSSLSAAARLPTPDRPAAELLDDRQQQPAVDLVESVPVHLEHLQRPSATSLRDAAVGAHLRVVAHPAQQPVRHARRAARARGHLRGRLALDRHAEDARRPQHDLLDVLLGVEVEPQHDPEARAQRRRQQPGPRRRADQRERLHRNLHRSRARPLADHDVELVVLHRGIEDLFDRRRHPVHFVDEEHLARLQVARASPRDRPAARSPDPRSAASRRRARWR